MDHGNAGIDRGHLPAWMDSDTEDASCMVSGVAAYMLPRGNILALSGDCLTTRYVRRETALCAHGTALSVYVRCASFAVARCAGGSVAAWITTNPDSSHIRADLAHSLAQAVGTRHGQSEDSVARDEHHLYWMAHSRAI